MTTYEPGPAPGRDAHLQAKRQRENDQQRSWCARCATCQSPMDGHERCGGEHWYAWNAKGCGILTGPGHSGGRLVRGLCGSCRAARGLAARRLNVVVLGGGLARREKEAT